MTSRRVPFLRSRHGLHFDRLGQFLERILAPILAVLAALAASAVLLLLLGKNPVTAYVALLQGALGRPSALGTTVTKALPLILGGLGVTIAYRAGVFNIGAEGQILMGGAFAAWVGVTPLGLPPLLHSILALLAGAAGGMIWSLVPAWLKARRGINEVIVTLLMNYIAPLLLGWIVRGPLRAPGQAYAKTADILASAQLPVIWPALRIHLGLVIAVLGVIFVNWMISSTTVGFRIRYIGANARAAEAAGIKVGRVIWTAFLMSGAFAGLAGAVHLLGSEHRMLETFLQGYGYDSIATALVGQLNPLGVFASAFFFGALRAGSNDMQIASNIPVTLVYVIQAFIILFVLISYQVHLGWRWPLSRQPLPTIVDEGCEDPAASPATFSRKAG